MSSIKQMLANKQNAQKGGVKTPAGKEVSKLNALKHGLLSQQTLMDDENESELIELGKNIRADLKPVGTIEMILVERIIANTWRLKRVLKAEVEMIEHDTGDDSSFGKALSYDFANHDSYGKFTRYETSIERGIYKAMHELQRIQAARNGEKPPLPMALDVIIDHENEEK